MILVSLCKCQLLLSTIHTCEGHMAVSGRPREKCHGGRAVNGREACCFLNTSWTCAILIIMVDGTGLGTGWTRADEGLAMQRTWGGLN